jgi:MFS family permease
MHEPAYQPRQEEIFSMADFIKRAPYGNFGRFVFYQAMFYIGFSITGPFFGWYWIDASGLGLNIRDFAILNLFQMITLFGAQPIIGRIADRIGNRKVMAWGALGLALNPALWLMSQNFWYCCALQVFSGIVWAAFSLASLNYIYDCVTPPKRARCMAFYTFFVLGIGSTIGCFAGAAIGEWLAYPVRLFGFSIDKFEMLLVASFIGRLWPNLVLLPTFKEMRVA